MSIDKIILNRQNLKRIQHVLNNLTDVDNFELTQEGGNGIGTILKMSYSTKIADIKGTFTTEISGPENW